MTDQGQPKLVVAVSGGIDSVVLLHKLIQAHQSLVVAHVNHGIRDDSDEDETFVRQLAASYEVPFVSTRLQLGPSASEETARGARYAWLEQQRHAREASAVATAHHQDDVLETIVLNLTRGTGWRGLCSLRSTPTRYRPLLSLSKADVIDYALHHELTWREDSTNESLRYLRNRIRHMVVPRLNAAQRNHLIRLYETQLTLRNSIGTEARKLVGTYRSADALERHPLIMADEIVSMELLRTWLGESLEQTRMRDLLLFAKTARAGAKWSLDSTRYIVADAKRLVVLPDRD